MRKSSSIVVRFCNAGGALVAASAAWGVAEGIGTLATGTAPSASRLVAPLIVATGGANLVASGILGAYVARIYHETRNRPPYSVADVHGGASTAPAVAPIP